MMVVGFVAWCILVKAIDCVCVNTQTYQSQWTMVIGCGVLIQQASNSAAAKSKHFSTTEQTIAFCNSVAYH